jgi:phage tail sheath protein FI
LSDAVDHGITVTEIASMDQPIDACPETTAAFVGRALRGPLNTPVLIRNFGEFRRRFGDVWGRSSLGPAAKHFFAHGGNRLYVVRVANNARGALLCLPASGSALVLRAMEPGSTEVIRVAVDYDGIDNDNEDYFNLTLQRINPQNGLIVDQEFFRQLSWQSDAASFVADELMTSEIAQVEQPFPMHRPEKTITEGLSQDSTYIRPAQLGTDGAELSNYDLVGSRRAQSGLFALEQIEQFDLLYMPPPGKGRDAGPAAILAAEMYCRERSAMLIVDPLLTWNSAAQAAEGIKAMGYSSPNLLGYYPRVTERGGDDGIARTAGGAIAGLLCKKDRMHGVWRSLDQAGLGLQRSLQPVCDLPPDDERLLVRTGLNVIRCGPTGKARLSGAVTMARGSEAYATFSQLPVRRFCLQLINTIVRATRWAVFETENDSLAKQLRAQILTYLDCLNDLGAFENDKFIVQCDAGVSKRSDSKEHGVTILLVFHPLSCDEPISLTLHQTASGFRVGSTAFGLTIRNSST